MTLKAARDSSIISDVPKTKPVFFTSRQKIRSCTAKERDKTRGRYGGRGNRAVESAGLWGIQQRPLLSNPHSDVALLAYSIGSLALFTTDNRARGPIIVMNAFADM